MNDAYRLDLYPSARDATGGNKIGDQEPERSITRMAFPLRENARPLGKIGMPFKIVRSVEDRICLTTTREGWGSDNMTSILEKVVVRISFFVLHGFSKPCNCGGDKL